MKRISVAQLKKMMPLNPTLKDCAGFLDCSEDTITRAIKKETGQTFYDFRDKYLGITRQKLRQKAFQMAMAGDRTVMIFLLKNYCGMKDNPEIYLEQQEVELEFIDEDDPE